MELLAPKRDPDDLRVLIPPGFLGKKLRLWFFVLTGLGATGSGQTRSPNAMELSAAFAISERRGSSRTLDYGTVSDRRTVDQKH